MVNKQLGPCYTYNVVIYCILLINTTQIPCAIIKLMSIKENIKVSFLELFMVFQAKDHKKTSIIYHVIIQHSKNIICLSSHGAIKVNSDIDNPRKFDTYFLSHVHILCMTFSYFYLSNNKHVLLQYHKKGNYKVFTLKAFFFNWNI